MKIVFVKRPKVDALMSLMDALRLTAKNGKAVQLRAAPPGACYPRLRRDNLLLHTAQSGKFTLAWCDNGAKPKGGR